MTRPQYIFYASSDPTESSIGCFHREAPHDAAKVQEQEAPTARIEHPSTNIVVPKMMQGRGVGKRRFPGGTSQLRRNGNHGSRSAFRIKPCKKQYIEPWSSMQRPYSRAYNSHAKMVTLNKS